MMEITQLDEIERIVYMWARYEGTRTVVKHTPHKIYSSRDIAELIERLKRYKDNPEKFEWDEGGVPEPEDVE